MLHRRMPAQKCPVVFGDDVVEEAELIVLVSRLREQNTALCKLRSALSGTFRSDETCVSGALPF